MSAAFRETRKEAEKYVKEFISDVKFKPDNILLVAGAIKHAAYGYYQEMIVTHNVLPEGAVENVEKDHEFTDWAELEKAIVEFVNG